MNSFNINNKSAYYYDFWRSRDTEDSLIDIKTEIEIIYHNIKKNSVS